MPFTSQAYLNTATRAQLEAEGVPLGVHPRTGDTFYLPERDRYAGMYIMGMQGVGKSGFLETLIHQDCQVGNAVVVIDPHGDLATNCLAALPPERVSQAYVLDMEDEVYPFGVNLFAVGSLDSDIKRTQAVDRIMHLFEVLWDDVLSQQNLPLPGAQRRPTPPRRGECSRPWRGERASCPRRDGRSPRDSARHNGAAPGQRGAVQLAPRCGARAA